MVPNPSASMYDSSDGEFYVQAAPRRMKTTIAAPERSYHGNRSSHVKSKPWNHNGNQLRQTRLDTSTMQFSGHKEGQSAYIRWEDDMEQWFQTWRIPESLKPSYARDTLVGEAYKWWDQVDADRIYYNDPPFTWTELKRLMYRNFVERAQHIQKVTTRRLVKPQVLQPANQRQSSKPVHTPQVKQNQGEYFKSLKPPEVICYRCQGQGHLAKDCPTKRAVKIAPHEAKETNLEVSDSFTSLDNSFARIDKRFDDLINLIKAGSNSFSSNSMNVLTHLSSAQKVENISDTNISKLRVKAQDYRLPPRLFANNRFPSRRYSKPDLLAFIIHVLGTTKSSSSSRAPASGSYSTSQHVNVRFSVN
ncbi:hypothetical protein Bca101_010065 [Brassica carinata]